jgi:hypothetical protein
MNKTTTSIPGTGTKNLLVNLNSLYYFIVAKKYNFNNENNLEALKLLNKLKEQIRDEMILENVEIANAMMELILKELTTEVVNNK